MLLKILIQYIIDDHSLLWYSDAHMDSPILTASKEWRNTMEYIWNQMECT